MTKKKQPTNTQESTYEKHIATLIQSRRKKFDEGYKELLLSEMLLAAMEEDEISVRKLAELAGVSPTIIQEIRSGKREHVSAKSIFKILGVLGYNLVAERNGHRIALDFSSISKNK